MRFQIMDQTGHKQIEFNSDVKAEQEFTKLLDKGYRAAVPTGDGTHTLIKDFDPTAEQTLFIPHLRGG